MEWVMLAIIAFGVIAVVVMYNRLVAARNQVRNLWRQIDVQLKRRYDLIPNLVNAVRDVMSFEQDTLTQVIEARGKAVQARNPGEKAQADSLVTQALGSLLAVVERYPELKSHQNVQQLTAELSTTENLIAGVRVQYNNAVRDYTNMREVVPSNFVAALFKFEPEAYFEASEQDKATPRVALR